MQLSIRHASACSSESHAVESATENMSGGGAAGSVAEAQPMASAKTMQDALQSPNFRQLATQLDSLTTHTGAKYGVLLLIKFLSKFSPMQLSLGTLITYYMVWPNLKPKLRELLKKSA
jgi:hypothetical protein